MTDAADALQRRLAELRNVADLGTGRLPAGVEERVATTVENASARLGHGTSHTVVALAGATGSGKSSLFNAIVGEELAPSSPRRPTTSIARAAIYGDGAEALLDWLEITQRHRISSTGDELDGLILLDLPDHDSTAATHRAEVERLVAVVDVFCWVVDPQKYADAALHDDYIQRFAGHGAVTLVALNQVDLLDAEAKRACLAHLGTLLTEDGLVGMRVVATSALTGEGVPELRRELAARTAERRAIVRRLDADLDWLAGDLFSAVGDTTPRSVSNDARDALVEAAAKVAGVDIVAEATGAAYRHRSSSVAGWPPVRWVRKLRPDPLKRLGIHRASADDSAGTAGDGTVSVRRTSLPTPAPGADVALASAGRNLAATVSKDLPTLWRERLDQSVSTNVAGLNGHLDASIATGDIAVDPARWWTLAGIGQRVVTAALAVGLIWLGVLFVLDWFHVPDPPLPKVNGWPLPTLLAIGGGLIGLAIAALSRRLAAIGARHRTQVTRAALTKGVAKVVDAEVIGPVNAELDTMQQLSDAVRKFQR